MNGVSLTCLGVGDGHAQTERNHSSFLYQCGATSLLLDCGEPVSRTFKAAGHSPDLVEEILLSHLHFDHLGGLFMLVQGWLINGRQAPLSIVLPGFGQLSVERLLNDVLHLDQRSNFPVSFASWKANSPRTVGDFRVTPFPTTHQENAAKRLPYVEASAFESFCFLLESKGLRIGHSADIGAPSDLEPLFDAPLDLLVCELAHFEPEELFAFLAGRRLSRLVLVHLSEANWNRRDEIGAEARKRLPDTEVIVPRDGELIRAVS